MPRDGIDAIPGLKPPVPQVPVPTPAPTNRPAGDRPIVNYGWSPPLIRRPLQLCAGDCDLDFDCAPGLVCFQRYLPYQAVPGCSGGDGDETLTDYCVPANALGNNNGLQLPPTSQPTDRPTDQPTDKPTEQPTDKPSPLQTPKPYKDPKTTPQPTSHPVKDSSGVPPKINCNAYSGANYNRLCKPDSCCENPRSSSDFCFEQYAIFGDEIESACYHCCNEQNGSPKLIGPAAKVNPNIPQTIACDRVERPERMCKPDSCCSKEGADSNWCRQQNALYPNSLESICVSRRNVFTVYTSYWSTSPKKLTI